MGMPRALLGAGLALLLSCGERGREPPRDPAPAPASIAAAEPEGLIRWAQRRADRDLQSFANWVSPALGSAPARVNQPLSEWGHDVGDECTPGKPPPERGFCSGAYRDASGWLARLTWKVDAPEVAAVEYDGYANHPLSCDTLGGTALGSLHTDAETRWVTRLCKLPHAQAVIHQMPVGGYHARTRIDVYDDRFVEREPLTARGLQEMKKNAGL